MTDARLKTIKKLRKDIAALVRVLGLCEANAEFLEEKTVSDLGVLLGTAQYELTKALDYSEPTNE